MWELGLCSLLTGWKSETRRRLGSRSLFNTWWAPVGPSVDDDGLLLVVAQLVLMPRPPTIHRSVTPATSLASSAWAQAYVSGPTIFFVLTVSYRPLNWSYLSITPARGRWSQSECSCWGLASQSGCRARIPTVSKKVSNLCLIKKYVCPSVSVK